MWQAPNQRMRALANSKKRERERLRKPLHVKRITATIQPLPSEGDEPSTTQENLLTPVRLILNDLSPKGAGLFSPTPFQPGQKISMSIKEPEHLSLKAKVIWCQSYHANSHVLSNQAYSFRMGVEFILTPTEEQELKIFCGEVAKNHVFSVRSV